MNNNIEFIFRDIFPKISDKIEYCINKLVAESCMEHYNQVHEWININSKFVTVVYKKYHYFGFTFNDSDAEIQFIEKFKSFMAPIEID